MALINTKICSRCKEEKSFDQFRKCKRGRYGIHGQCIMCHDLSSKESYDKNQEYRIEMVEDWNIGHPTQSREYKRNWARRNKK